MPLPKDVLGKKLTIDRKAAAQQQIDMAWRLMKESEFACAITLALAAEERLPDTDKPHVLKSLRQKAPQEMEMFNQVRNWLKHDKPPDEIEIFEFEVALALMRAVSKFRAVYGQASAPMDAFVEWTREKGLLRPKDASALNP